MNIVLIGYRGSGKSSLGKLLAEKLGADFIDTDVLITERAGKTIQQIFAAESEAGFRQREVEAIAEVAARDHLVIAAGGGAVLNPQNVRAFKRCGKIIWLKADAGTLHQRIHADPATAATRPSLTAMGGTLEEVQKLVAQRAPLYAAAADETLDVTHLSQEQALERLLAWLV